MLSIEISSVKVKFAPQETKQLPPQPVTPTQTGTPIPSEANPLDPPPLHILNIEELAQAKTDCMEKIAAVFEYLADGLKISDEGLELAKTLILKNFKIKNFDELTDVKSLREYCVGPMLAKLKTKGFIPERKANGSEPTQ